jgi:hypothetical protein
MLRPSLPIYQGAITARSYYDPDSSRAPFQDNYRINIIRSQPIIQLIAGCFFMSYLVVKQAWVRDRLRPVQNIGQRRADKRQPRLRVRLLRISLSQPHLKAGRHLSGRSSKSPYPAACPWVSLAACRSFTTATIALAGNPQLVGVLIQLRKTRNGGSRRMGHACRYSAVHLRPRWLAFIRQRLQEHVDHPRIKMLAGFFLNMLERLLPAPGFAIGSV